MMDWGAFLGYILWPQSRSNCPSRFLKLEIEFRHFDEIYKIGSLGILDEFCPYYDVYRPDVFDFALWKPLKFRRKNSDLLPMK